MLSAVALGLLCSAVAQAETVIRVVSFEYDATTGLLTKETVEPDDANYRVITTYAYDSFGNRLTSTSSGAGVTSRTTTHTYDANGRFALTTTNTLGHTETRTYDVKFGGVLTQTGPNGLTTTNQYDKWGRLTQTTAPDGAVTQRTYALLTEGMETCTTSSAAPQRCEVSDRLGRPSYVKRPSFHSGVHVLESRTLYDRAGRPYLQLRPGEGTTMFSGHSGGTASFYDLSGRVVEVRDVDSEVTSGTSSPLAAIGNPCNAPSCLKTTYTYGYDVGTRQTWVRSTDPKGQQETRYSDFAGRLVQVTDALNNSTTYAYNATGQLTQTTDPLGNKITTAYNKRGEKSSTTDPDMGTWTYEYTVYGELWRQTDAKAQVTTMVYDALGRLIQRSEPEMVSYWRYDTYQDSSPCPKGIGKLCSAWVSHGYERKHIYDAYGRSSTVQIKVDGNWYDTSYTYDGNGRLATLTYPNGFAVTYAYTASNHPWKVVRNDTGSTIYEVVSDRYAPTTGSHREYKAVYGDGFQEQRLWDKHGRPTTTTYRSPSNALVRSQQLTYDLAENVASKVESTQVGSFTENYGYDALNRLTSSYGAGLPSKVYQYNAIGNLTFKTGAGNYTYPASGASSVRPHAVTSVSGTVQDGITGATYAYDANGNMTSGGGHVMTWTSFNRVKRLSQTWWGDWYRSFTYNGEYERVKTVQSDPVEPSGQTIYINPGTQQVPFYEVTTGSEASTRVYVSFGGRVVSQVRTTIANGVMQYHLMTDSQGSIISEGAYGNVTQDMAYDAWGKTRNPDDGSDYGLPPEGGWAWHNNRLYTGHESHQDQYVINMNGRLYDPVLSRMMSADPFVPGNGTNPQGLNRYAYVFNNPLRYTDPDGFKPIWKKQWFRVAVAVAASVAIPAATEAWFTVALNSATAGAVAAGAAGGFAGGLIASGGNLEAAFKGAVVGAAGGWADTLKGFEAVAGKAAAGCLSGAVQGGGCGQGARSAVVGKAVSVGVDSAQAEYGRAGEFVAATVGGGITSRIDGESFGKGARRAASMMTAVEASRYYESKVGWQADARPGDEVYVNSKGERGAYDERMYGGRTPGSNTIVIGRNNALTDDFWSWSNFDKQGGPLSLALNILPGMNATGHLHDGWFNSGAIPDFNHITNFGSMIPAAAVTYSAVLGNHLHGWHQNSTSWSYISQSQRQRR